MIKAYSYYHKDTGIFTGVTVMASWKNAVLNCPPDHVMIEGQYDPQAVLFDLVNHVVAPLPEGRSMSAMSAVPSQAEILTEITRLEATQHTAVRELLLMQSDAAKAQLQAIEDAIAALRAQLP